MLIFVPTFNERDNAERMFRQLAALGLDADILFLDDNSPDGTGEILDRLAKENPRLSVIHRPGRLGIGTAHLDGIAWAYNCGYDILITLDCDFTHTPADVLRLLEKSDSHDVVVGSRWMKADSLPGWNFMRRSLTNLGHLLTRTLLRMPYDATGAFRVYNLQRIPRAVFELVQSRGYAFFLESMFLFTRNGISIAEIPIVLPSRTYGESKMSVREAAKSGLYIFSLYAADRSDPSHFRISQPLENVNPDLVDPQGWDDYWNRKKTVTKVGYELIAAMYRTSVIRRRLNFFLRRTFAPHSLLLHAGCGSGQVDLDVQNEMRITALDISVPALKLYRKNNPRAQAVVHGSILSLPFPDESFDGVYNLGVLEHFQPPDIEKILAEFYRVLKPGGKVVIFWPHRRGSSVLVLNTAHWLMGRVLGNGERLHPQEVSLVRSRIQVKSLLTCAGLKMLDYSFTLRDAFVQVVVVAMKPATAEQEAFELAHGREPALSVSSPTP
jgi:dolichol-phosphate mannosyltransferase